VLDLDALITQQAFREAITDSEVSTAKHRQQHILDYIQVWGKGCPSVILLKKEINIFLLNLVLY